MDVILTPLEIVVRGPHMSLWDPSVIPLFFFFSLASYLLPHKVTLEKLKLHPSAAPLSPLRRPPPCFSLPSAGLCRHPSLSLLRHPPLAALLLPPMHRPSPATPPSLSPALGAALLLPPPRRPPPATPTIPLPCASPRPEGPYFAPPAKRLCSRSPSLPTPCNPRADGARRLDPNLRGIFPVGMDPTHFIYEQTWILVGRIYPNPPQSSIRHILTFGTAALFDGSAGC